MPLLPYRDPAPSPTLMRVLGHVNRLAVLPHVLRVSRLDLPAADRRRLQGAVNQHTAAFVAPGHPEFMTDWMIDKEISRQFAPRLASWAAQDIVNTSPLAQRFWLANGLIANTPGGGGKAYSLKNARAGHGVLLHPEGAVNWQAEHISPLHPGAIDMAVTMAQVLEAEQDPRPVFVVPMVWRLRFTSDVSVLLIREMQHIERARELAVWPATQPADRLAGLLGALLTQQAHALGLRRPELTVAKSDRRYFDAQAEIITEIRGRLSKSYGPLDDDPMHAMRTIGRGIRRRANVDPERAARDRALMMELHRLSRIDPALYGKDTLTQEQIAEILKATRTALVTSGFRNRLHNFLPRAVAPRVAHVRVAEPMDIRALIASGVSATSMLTALRSLLQDAQDALGTELEQTVRPFRQPSIMAPRLSNGYAAAV